MNHKTSMTLKVLLLLLVTLGFNSPSCDSRPPTLSCDTIALTVDPGTCVEIPPPCHDHQWVRLDAFRLCDAPDGLFIQTQRDPRKRFLCADARVGQLINLPVEYYYARPSDSGIGTLLVTSGSAPLLVAASASPSSIPIGGTSQLDTTVSGGRPPYIYSWSPASGLSATDISNPVASPTVSTQYTVVVSDSNGLIAGASVIVNVGLSATAVANPPTIDPGQSSNLSVVVNGGTPPYSYSWTPAASLSDPNVGSPVATPFTMTTYTITVTDFHGATAFADVSVEVNLSATPTANPASILAGGQSQLEAQVRGGAPPYTFAWTPPATLSNPTLQNPVATPMQTTTYDVLVTDSRGRTANGAVTVQVTPVAIQACFTVSGSGFSRSLDGSCSIGSINLYRWWCDFLGGAQSPTGTGPSPFFICLYETPGSKQVRLEVVDGNGNSSATRQVITVP